MAGLLEIIVILWKSIHRSMENNKEAKVYTIDKFASVLPEYLKVFQVRWAPVWAGALQRRWCSFLPTCLALGLIWKEKAQPAPPVQGSWSPSHSSWGRRPLHAFLLLVPNTQRHVEGKHSAFWVLDPVWFAGNWEGGVCERQAAVAPAFWAVVGIRSTTSRYISEVLSYVFIIGSERTTCVTSI